MVSMFQKENKQLMVKQGWHMQECGMKILKVISAEQARQREVVTKIVNKVVSLDGVSNYRKLLDAAVTM